MRIFCRSAAHLGLFRVFFTNLSWNGSLGSDSGFVDRLLKQWSLPQCTQPSVLRNHGGALSKMWWPGSILLEAISGYTNPDQRIPKWFSELLCFFTEYDGFFTGLAAQGVGIRKSFPEGLLPHVDCQKATQTTYSRLKEAWRPWSYPHLKIKPTRKKAGA